MVLENLWQPFFLDLAFTFFIVSKVLETSVKPLVQTLLSVNDRVIVIFTSVPQNSFPFSNLWVLWYWPVYTVYDSHRSTKVVESPGFYFKFQGLKVLDKQRGLQMYLSVSVFVPDALQLLAYVPWC